MGLVPIFSLILSGCSLFGNDDSTSTPTSEPTSIPTSEPTSVPTSAPTSAPTTIPTSSTSTSYGTPIDPDIADKNVTGISLKYTKDFYMQVGDTLDFSVSFKGGGGDDQKGIVWYSTDTDVVSIETKEKTSQCVLSANHEGSALIVARSTYDPTLTDSVTITVIDNSIYTYIWQMNSGETYHKAFNDEEGKTKTDGTIDLNGLEWEFHFDTPNKSVGGGQALTFGSNDAPYGNITFKAANTRHIRSISVLCSSSAIHIDDGSEHGKSGDEGSSRISITIGDTKYVDDIATPKYSTDQPLDTVTGITVDDDSLSGDIFIHFTPTYKNVETKENAGAIYLKSIIIEYYRGDLISLSIPEDSRHQNEFFVGNPFETNGLVVNAYYSQASDTPVVVNRYCKIATTNLDQYGNFISPVNEQTVNVSYTYNDVTRSTSYKISVSKRVKGFNFVGSMKKTTYLVNEELNYDGISFSLVLSDDTIQEKVYELKDFNTDEFKTIFDVNQVQQIATKQLENGFVVEIKHRLSNLVGTYLFKAGDIIVKEVAKIEVSWPEATEYSAELYDGELMDFTKFVAKITYDNDEYDEFTLKELDKNRYEYKTLSPLVASENLETSGFDIRVQSILNNKLGSYHVDPGIVKVLTASEIKINGNFVKTDYYRGDYVDYDGLTIDVTYDDDSVLKYPVNEANSYSTYIEEMTTKGKVATKVDMFELVKPERVTFEMMDDGFDISVKHVRSGLSNNYIVESGLFNVQEYLGASYTKITDESQIVSGASYIITYTIVDDISKMKVWDGSLDKDNIFKAGNYIDYDHGDIIGDNPTINEPRVEKAVISLTFETTEEGNVYTLWTQSGLKLSITKSGCSLVGSGKNANGLTIRFTEEGNVKILCSTSEFQKQIYYYKTNDCIKPYNVPSRTDSVHLPVQLYKLNTAE